MVSSQVAQAMSNKTEAGVKYAYDRLSYAELNLEGQAGQVLLAYMADDKDLVS